MAKQDGFLQFTGTINGISFYNSKYGRIVRAKGGPDPKKMKTSPRFVRTRENGKEFGMCGKAAGYLRKALITSLRESSDHTVVGRLTKALIQVKNCDTLSVRGKRNPEAGLKTLEGKALLNGFDFNGDALLRKVVKKAWSLDMNTGTLNLNAFDPKLHLKKPKGATHVRMSLQCVRLNFLSGKSQGFTSSAELVVKGGPVDVSLIPDGVPTWKGNTIYLLQVCFFQEINGMQYLLQNGSYNTMAIVGVG